MTFRSVLVSVVAAGAATSTLLSLPVHAQVPRGQVTTLNNDITDVTGVLVGQVTDDDAHTGTTVVYAPATATAGIDVRGGSPITRETDVFKPTNEVQKLNAVLLTGGGEYGLAAGPGAMEWLRANNQGFPVGFTPDQVVPIVPGAAINDLRPGRDAAVRPDFQSGHDAVAAAGPGPVEQGNIGAGAGAVTGGLKGGVGSASVEVAPGVVVGALVVVDSLGSPADLTSGCTLLGAQYGTAGEFDVARPPGGCGSYALPAAGSGARRRGGVIGVVATNVTLDKAMNQKVAEIAHDGVTRAIGPAHGMGDGDTFFAISTDVVTPVVGVLPDCLHAALKQTALGCQLLYNQLLGAAQTVVSRAIAHAVLNAESVPGLASSYCDTFADACGAAAAGAAAARPTSRHITGKPAAKAAAALPAADAFTSAAGTGRLFGLAGWLALAAVGAAAFALGARAVGGPWRRPVLLARRPSRRRVAAALATLAAVPLIGITAATQAQSPVMLDDPGCQSDTSCLALVDRIGEAAKRTMARAVVDAMTSAKTVDSSSSYCDEFPGACATSGGGGYPNARGKRGPYNNITDVPGVEVGTYTDPTHIGTTVLLMRDGAHVGVEVRGSAPGGRGTDAMRSEQADDAVHAIVLTGGSAFGLEAADGVVRYLEQQKLGVPLGVPGAAVMPTVPTSVIFDLGRFGRPWTSHGTADFGFKAVSAAKKGALESGNVGAGAGAQAGGLKGGLGYASQDLGDGIVIGAVVDINAFGSAVDVATGCTLLAARYQLEDEFGGLRPPPAGCDDFTGSPFGATGAGENTTIGVVATNAPLSRALLSKVAQYGQDGLALAMRPSHTYFDGDTIWAVSTAQAAPMAPPAPAPTRPRAVLPATGGTPVVAAVGLAFGMLGAVVGWRRRQSSPTYDRSL